MISEKKIGAWTPLDRLGLARRVAQDIPDGWHVNLGIGVPTLVANHVPQGREVVFHSENGILGLGPAPLEKDIDPWLVNAGKQYVTLVPGGSYFHHADSFTIIRGKHLDLCVLGAFEVAQNGDLANWSTATPGAAPAVGGAMDLAVGAKRLWVVMDHTTKSGRPKLVRECAYPLTAPACVSRVYTSLAVLDVIPKGFRVVEMVPGISFEELQSLTGADLVRPESNGSKVDRK